ncbi:MAG: hypothetical protein WHX93_15220 [bacterium]
MGSRYQEMREKPGLDISAHHALLVETWDLGSFTLGRLVFPWILRHA